MKNIVGRIERSEVPVITWVGPPGAEAVSAGTFIAMAGHVAAMAPNTTIGAATPVTATGEDVEGALGKQGHERHRCLRARRRRAARTQRRLGRGRRPRGQLRHPE